METELKALVSEEDLADNAARSNKTNPEIPPWKKEYLEKKKDHQTGKVSSSGASQIPISNLMRRRSKHLSETESAFTRQVVNSGITQSSRKKISPSNSGSLTDVSSTYLTQKRIERVQRARLYLLQQTGPNSFLIGGDSPDHKFRVIIGPQTCSCGRGPHCVHVLFVMLRVFQVGESDPCLSSKTLKNYEVENLFRIYHDKRSSRLTQRRQEKPKEIHTPEEGTEQAVSLMGGNSNPSENDAGGPCQALGEDLVNCLFSRNWSIRETGLKHLGKELVGTLLRSAGEGRSGAIVSSTRTAATQNMLETTSHILAHMCADPVYRVFVASLRSMRTMLGYTPCRDEHQRERLQKLLKPIVDAIFLKCTDGNRRTSQLSLSTLVELAKGQNGELAVGREIVNPGTDGLHGLDFVVKCATEDYNIDSVQWQWLLGRLYIIDKLIEEFPNDFLPHRILPDGAGAAVEKDEPPEEAGAASENKPSQDPPHQANYARLMSVAHFAVKAVCSSHMRIARMSRRVFLLSAKLGAHLEQVIDQLEELLNNISSSSILSLKRKLRRIVADFQLSEKIVHELQHGSEKLVHGTKFESTSSTPVDSPLSSPRCHSPSTVVLEEAGDGSKQNSCPVTSPIIPQQKTHRKLRRHSARRSFRECSVSRAAPSPQGETDLSTFGREGKTDNAVVEASIKENVSSTFKPPTNLPCASPPRPLTPPRTLACFTPTIKVNSILVSSGQYTAVERRDRQEECGNETLRRTYLDSSVSLKMGEMTMFVDEGEIKSPPPDVLIAEEKKSFSLKKCCCPCHQHDTSLYDDAASQTSGFAGVHNSPQSYRNRFHTAEQESMSSDDFLDFSASSTSNNEKPVSFKSEVAESPKSSPSHTLSGGSQHADCTCKEEVEKEEAEALALAMEVSEQQTPIPIVPGLTPTAREEVITIRIQPDEANNGSGDMSTRNSQTYMEGFHWVKGPLLGTGAFSTCYQARDARTGVIMAVKQISFCRNSPVEQESVIEAITTEIHMMSRLSHPNVVRILGATKQGCHFNMFVEWMPGGSVSYLLGQYGAFTEHVIINYTRQILRGLAYLHDNHILHRDLKGANLLLDSTGQLLRIGDFGASARLASQSTGAGEFQGQLLGTIAFMAPEVLRGESYGRACDVWSVGCVMIEMSTCRPPWNSHDISNHLALIFKIASSVDPPPIPDNLSPPVRDLLLRCLEQKSEFRPPAKDLLMHPLFIQYSNK
ncbi:hypothetical protein C0Q70_16624 [Pomacea canaliculata]|uniref:Protein kinase domain-containing protein n=1 Tax=Pomacea canaliculata TaxID=400727 RepID=A0A2T7NQC9_POMCA|nr:hypothetical protein C0Q70_16624 [Pomacea canaliculata]